MVDFEKIERDFRYIDCEIRAKGREILKDYDITIPQFMAIFKIIKYEGITIGELSKQMYIAYSTVSELIDRMEELKLVIRKKDEKDKRIRRIYAQNKAKKILEEVLYRRVQHIKFLLENSKINSHDFEYTLDKMRKFIDEREKINE